MKIYHFNIIDQNDDSDSNDEHEEEATGATSPKKVKGTSAD